MNGAKGRAFWWKCLSVGVLVAGSLSACGKDAKVTDAADDVPAPTLTAATFEQRFLRPNPPDWAQVIIVERHFLLSTQQMYDSHPGIVYFHSFDECQTNLRNYSAWQAQGALPGAIKASFMPSRSISTRTTRLPSVLNSLQSNVRIRSFGHGRQSRLRISRPR